MPAARVLSDQMMSYWSQFAYTGDPGGGRSGDQPQWKSWGADRGQFIVFDTPSDGGLHFSDATLTRPTVLAQIAVDDRFESVEERCEIYADFVRFGRQLSKDDYAAIDDGLCKTFPIEED